MTSLDTYDGVRVTDSRCDHSDQRMLGIRGARRLELTEKKALCLNRTSRNDNLDPGSLEEVRLRTLRVVQTTVTDRGTSCEAEYRSMQAAWKANSFTHAIGTSGIRNQTCRRTGSGTWHCWKCSTLAACLGAEARKSGSRSVWE